MSDAKELKIPFKAPLRPGDTEGTTFGCRANNPDICKNNGIQELCESNQLMVTISRNMRLMEI